MFVATIADGVPKLGVTRVGEFENTADPPPVSSLNTPANCADVVEANCESGLATFPNVASNVDDMSITGAVPPVDAILLVVPDTDVTGLLASEPIIRKVLLEKS
jgi:hypothetical protein